MVKVYFEHKTHAELIAVFSSSESYAKATEKLEKVATDQGLCLTESVTEEDTDEEIEKFLSDVPKSYLITMVTDFLNKGKIGGIITASVYNKIFD